MAKFSQVLLISLLMVTQVYSQDEQNLFVTLKDGEVKGLILKSYGGRVFHAFKGIRYGKPAAGLLRFKVSWMSFYCYQK